MNILLLGAEGFVGSNVRAVFGRHGVSLCARSRRDGWDLTDEEQTRRNLQEIEPQVIINCAALVGSLNYVSERAAEIVDQNMRMLLSLYHACAEVAPQARIINPVANCAFPGHLTVYRESSLWEGEPHSTVLSYGATRRMMIVLAQCYREQFGLRSLNLFVPNMYGPHDSTDPNKAHALNALVAKVVKAKAEGSDRLDVWGTGRAVREWLYVGDFARLLVELVPRPEQSDDRSPVSVAQNKGWSVKAIVETIVEETGFEGQVVWDKSKPDGAFCKVMDDTRFRARFPGFQFISLREGVRETLRYYESIYPY